MGLKRRKLVGSCGIGREYVQIHRYMLATHSYKKKPVGPLENELDLKEGRKEGREEGRKEGNLYLAKYT